MNRDRALEVIRNLEARAERTTFPAEAESCRDKIALLRDRFAIGDQETRIPDPEPVRSRPQGPPPDGTVVGRDAFGRPIVIVNGRPYVIVQEQHVNTGTGTGWFGNGNVTAGGIPNGVVFTIRF